MSDSEIIRVQSDSRFARFEAVSWWRQEVLRNAKVLVAGAGALGNEVLKNLALLGVGNIAIADFDVIESSNLSRSVLFRPQDVGRPKADVAADAVRELYPEASVHTISGNIMAELGYGWFDWADIIIGALDNREARLFLNKCAYYTGKPWIDGGIDVFNGVVRGFHPPETACYCCTMSKVDWDLVEQRRSCSLIAKRAMENAGTPTTPTVASVIAAIQVQEVLKHLHGMDYLKGSGFVFEGLTHGSYSVTYPINPNCELHDAPEELKRLPELTSDSPWRQIWERAETELGGLDAIDFDREIVSEVTCGHCQKREAVYQNAETVPTTLLECSQCQQAMTPDYLHSINRQNLIKLGARTPRQTGLPQREIVWARRDLSILGLVLDT